DDFDLLLPACAAAHEEELGIDPMRRDPAGFRWRTRIQIEEGRSWLWRDGDTILFKAEASAWTPNAVQIQQVWVSPDVRNRGYAKRGMRALCAKLLEVAPVVCLFVRPENAPAIAVYEGIGMRHTISYRSLIFACPCGASCCSSRSSTRPAGSSASSPRTRATGGSRRARPRASRCVRRAGCRGPSVSADD